MLFQASPSTGPGIPDTQRLLQIRFVAVNDLSPHEVVSGGALPRSAWLIVNPAAGDANSGGKTADEMSVPFRAAGWSVEVHETRPERDAAAIAREAVGAGVDTVLVAGGDGTVGLVARTLCGSGVAIGILPTGTFNNIARSIGMPSELHTATVVILAGDVRKIDAGELDGRRTFFEAAGIGLDATIFPLGEEVKEGNWTKWWDIAARTLDYPAQTFHLTLRGYVSSHGHRHAVRVLRRRALLVVVANGPYYGGGFTVSPGARIGDGLLTITIYRDFSKLELLGHFFSIRRGKLRRSPKVETLQAREVVVRSTRAVPVHADGEPTGRTPVVIRCLPDALLVHAPSDATSEAEATGARIEARKALQRSFAEVKNDRDAEAALDQLEQNDDVREEEIPDREPEARAGEQSAAIRTAVDSAARSDKPAAGLAETAVQVASASEGYVLDDAIEEAARDEASPRVERGRSLLREALLRRLKPFDAVDTWVFLAVNHLPHPRWVDRAFWHFSRVMTGGHAWLLVLALAMAKDRPSGWRIAARVLPALYLTTFLVEVPVKRYFRRKRPFISIIRAVVVGRKPGSYSFPSGHSAAAFAGATLLSRPFPRWRGVFFAVAGLVAFSRVYLGAHYPGDVVTGGLLGTMLARTFRAVFRTLFRGSRR